MKTACVVLCIALLIWGCGGDSGNASADTSPSAVAPTAVQTEPLAPSELDAHAVSSNRINLAWVDNASDEDGFILERSSDPTFSTFTQFDIAADLASYSDTGLDPNTLYHYRIRAYNGAGGSAHSDPITATTQAATAQDARRVFAYGFEDWTGDADTTPGYFSSTSFRSYWDIHKASTEVVASNNPACGNRSAFEGNYYFHQNFYDGGVDTCLGTTATSINAHTNIGVNLRYPEDPKSDFDISSAITSSTMTIRFYFRTTGNWPNATTNMMKFIRVISETARQTCIVMISDDGSSFDITDHPHPDNPNPSWGDFHNMFTAPINWNDAQWHSVVMVVERLNDNSTPPNLRVSAWFDDWNMNGPAHGIADVYVGGFGTTISHIALFVNWSNTYPISDMGLDLDNIEIWNGRP